MTKYRIVPKRDFGPMGFWINKQWVRQGFVVTRDGCNCMPGATWFRTTAEAMRAIQALEDTGGGSEFWARVRAPIPSQAHNH